MTNTKWVYRGFGHWKEFPVDSPEALAYQKALNGMLPKWRERRELEFRTWHARHTQLMAQRAALDWQMVAFKEPVVDLYKALAPDYRDWVLEADGRDECVRSQMVALDRIIPTQDDVNLELVRWYKRSGYTRDTQNKLPLGLRFDGSDDVYLINGHHRYAAAIDRAHGAHKTMYMDVDSIDISFDEACGNLEDFPINLVELFELLTEVA